MQSIGIDLKILVVQIINFFILFFLLRWILYKPIVKILSERKKRIEESLVKAEKTQKESLELGQKNKEIIIQAKNEALAILDNAKKQSELTKKETLEQAKNEAQILMKKAETRILEQKQEMLKEINNETAKLTISIAKKILKKNIDTQTEKELIDQSLTEIKNNIRK